MPFGPMANPFLGRFRGRILEGEQAAHACTSHLSERHPGQYNSVYPSSSMIKPAKSLLLATFLTLACQPWAQQTLPSGSSAPPQKQNPPQRPSEPSTTLKVDVNLVNVFVTVTDQHGAPIGGLTKENFVLKEDDREQQIRVFDKESALPLSIALEIDTSLSTRHDLPLEQASAKRFAHEILRPIDGLSVYTFSEIVKQVTQGYTADLKRIDESIDHIHVGAATALFDAIYEASRSLDRRKGRKVIVLITDGGDTISSVDYKEALRAAEEAEAIVYSIIIVPIATEFLFRIPQNRSQGCGSRGCAGLSRAPPGRVLQREVGILVSE